MNHSVEVCPGLPAEWPALAAGGPLLATPGWMRAMQGRLGQWPVTVVVRAGERTVLAAYGAVQQTPRPGEFFDLHHVLVSPAPALPLTPDARARRSGLVADAPPPEQWVPNLVVMLPGYECVPVGPAAQHPDAVAALVEGTLAWARRTGLPTTAFLYTRPESVVLADTLATRGFTGLPLSLTWDLDLPGRCLADYVAALPHKRRIEARREQRLLRERGVEIRSVEVDPVFDELVRLRCELTAKYRGRADPAAESARLRRLVDDVAGGRPRVLVALVDRVVVGFALFAQHASIWHCLAVGFDYTNPRSRLTYFGTVFYAAAQEAYAAGIRRLSYGQGAWQAKRSRGCRPTVLTGWVHSVDLTLRRAVSASAAVTELVTA
ncbi:MAG: GNAT family N-acetyltransferase [Actinobacteria bacterium]|nr:GNAT family N-acetyltransferase [Actinomycetota bacterium]